MPDISKRLEKAEKLVQKGRLDEATQEYLAAWKEDSNNEAVGEILAELYLRQNQSARALECYEHLFDRSAERNNGPRAVLLFRKMAKLGAQVPARTLAAARFLEKQKPDEAQELLRTSAQALLEAGDKERAFEALARLAVLDDSNAEVHLRLGEVAESLGEKEVAASAFLRASEFQRSGSAFRLCEGRSGGLQAAMPGGDLKVAATPAIALLERAYALLPADGAVVAALANALLEGNQPARAVQLLEAAGPDALPDRSQLLAQAYLAAGEFARAEQCLWQIAPRSDDVERHLMQVAEGYLRGRNSQAALLLLKTLKKEMFAAGKDRQFIGFVEALQQKDLAPVEVLEFLASLYNEINSDSLYNDTLGRLFDLYLNAREHGKAATALEHMIDIDSYDAEHSRRLERLAGKLDERRYQTIASRLGQAATAPAAAPPASNVTTGDSPGEKQDENVLEDLILQAEIFLQYGLRPRALERLERIARQFPGAENNNEKLRALYASADFTVPSSAAAGVRPGAVATTAAAEPIVDDAITDITHVSEITRKIYRQTTVKGVLSAAVNEIGRIWRASRCLAGLCAPGKLPSAALEYCAPGVAQSDVKSIVKLITTLVGLTADGNPLAVEDAASSSRIAAMAPVVQAAQIKSLLALPMVDADQAIGIIVLEHCERMRHWRSNETVVLKTLVEQVVICISHVKLRSLMKSLAVHDEQSGLLNRNSYIGCLLSECERAQKQCMPLSVILLQFGHGPQTARERGEGSVQAFVQQAAQAVVAHLRQNDIAVRYDTGTLALVLPDTKGKDGFFVVDKIRQMVSGIKIGEQEPLPLTAGIAEAVLQGRIDPVDSVTELVNRVEAALEAAQKDGGPTSKLLLPAVS